MRLEIRELLFISITSYFFFFLIVKLKCDCGRRSQSQPLMGNCIQTFVYVYLFLYGFVYICMYVYVFVYICVCMCMHICLYDTSRLLQLHLVYTELKVNSKNRCDSN